MYGSWNRSICNKILISYITGLFISKTIISALEKKPVDSILEIVLHTKQRMLFSVYGFAKRTVSFGSIQCFFHTITMHIFEYRSNKKPLHTSRAMWNPYPKEKWFEPNRNLLLGGGGILATAATFVTVFSHFFLFLWSL